MVLLPCFIAKYTYCVIFWCSEKWRLDCFVWCACFSKVWPLDLHWILDGFDAFAFWIAFLCVFWINDEFVWIWMNFAWGLQWCRMDFVWMFNGFRFSLNFEWFWNGLLIQFGWIPNGCWLDFIWILHFLDYILWMFHVFCNIWDLLSIF